MIEINGNSFSNLSEFYDEFECKLTRNISFKIGRNLNAVNDVLYGGFGIHDVGNNISITWLNHMKSKDDLGWPETISYIESKLLTCHPSNVEDVKIDLEAAKNNQGDTLYDILVDLIGGHECVELTLS